MAETDLALIEQRIYTIRGVRVILDSDLAAPYGVPTKRLNEQYRRNRKRFTEHGAAALCSQAHNDAEDLLNDFVHGVMRIRGARSSSVRKRELRALHGT